MRTTAASAVAGLLIVFASMAGLEAQALEQVTVGLSTRTSLNYAPHYLAQAKYLKEEGLDVQFVTFDGSAALIPQLTSKRILAGWAAPDMLAIARDPKRDRMPLVFFYNGSRIAPWEFIVPQDSPIGDIADLRGKRIGVLTLQTGNVPITEAMLKDLGMERGKDYELMATGAGSAALHALQSGQVDVLNLFDSLHARYELNGAKIRRLEVDPRYWHYPQHGFIVHEDTLSERRGLLERLGRGMAKATAACKANTQACVRNAWSMHPSLKPGKGSDEEKMQASLQVLKPGLARYVMDGDQYRWGEFKADGLQDLVNALHSGGQISTNAIDPHSLYTGELLDAINDFDEAAVTSEARSGN